MPAKLNASARAYIYATILMGGLVLVFNGLLEWRSADPLRFLCYFCVALLSSGLKVDLPSLSGAMSVSFLFVMLGLAELTPSETIILGCVAALGQCLYGNSRKKTDVLQILFQVSGMAIAVAAAYSVYSSLFWRGLIPPSVVLLLASLTFFLLNTFPVAAALTLKENRPLKHMFRECYLWGFPYYVVGACGAWGFSAASQKFGWQVSMLLFPVVYLIYRSYSLYLGRLEAEKKHAEQIAGLHLRTIEALALAIEAKDLTTHDHLQRVRVYAIEIGKELGLNKSDLEALHAAALLHDIGKLAVPEHIVAKPGKLTREEFEKMKIHPVVGAEILERVKFPYPVVPIVRSHHEKWNGSGYPDGLSGEEIPLGARILSAVDCLDALASDRQYRRAIPLDQAMRHVSGESGISYDPRVVEILERRYLELERKANALEVNGNRLLTDLRVQRGDAPATGFAASSRPLPAQTEARPAGDFLSSIAAARQEVQTLFELSQDLGNSLSLDETLSVLGVRLKRIIPFDALAIYILRDDKLRPEYVTGENVRLFSSLEIPYGSGLSGWVAEHRKTILNGNPNVECGYLNDPEKFTALRSALAVPLEGINGVIGVITLYHADRDLYTRDHVRILTGVTTKLSISIENALRFRQAEQSASTDYLTSLPNTRSLFLHLDSEIARCRRLSTPLVVMVCDLNGFKMVNDRFGHLVGNQVLKTVARNLRASCREYDYVARMGGDEFTLVFPGLDASAIPAKVAHMDQMATEAACEVNPETRLSLSVGVATFPEHGTDAEQLLAEADRRMYRNKQARKMEADNNRGFLFDRKTAMAK